MITEERREVLRAAHGRQAVRKAERLAALREAAAAGAMPLALVPAPPAPPPDPPRGLSRPAAPVAKYAALARPGRRDYRRAIFDALIREGRLLTVMEIAVAVGVSRTAIHYHVTAMLARGELGRRGHGRRYDPWRYGIAAVSPAFDRPPPQPAGVVAGVARVREALASADAEGLMAAMRAGGHAVAVWYRADTDTWECRWGWRNGRHTGLARHSAREAIAAAALAGLAEYEQRRAVFARTTEEK